LLAVIVAGVLVRFFFAGLYRVDTASMEPTIHGKPPEHVLVLYWGVGAPARFDLVVLLREGHSEAEVKRVAGLPREKVALLEGDLMIDDQRLGREEPRPAPIPVYEQSRQAFAQGFEKPAVPFVENEDGWELDTSALGPDEEQGFAYRHALNDDYLDVNHERVPGTRAVGDGMVECEIRVQGEAGRCAWRLSERGDVFELELEVSNAGSTARLRRIDQKGAAEELARESVEIVPGRWHRMAFSNIDNDLRFDLDGVRGRLTHAYSANRPAVGVNSLHLMPRVAFLAQGLVVGLREVRVLRDLHYTAAGRYATQGPLQLGPDEIFVLGDNSAASQDGRMWGPVSLGELIGRPAWVVWPLRAARGL
jgi:signal peptidase I